MTRFAILCHVGPQGRHWDFLLEGPAALRTWALPQLPQAEAELICEALPDHRLAYLDYEGPISDGRGTVARCDRGTYAVLSDSLGELLIELCGARFCGQVSLRPVPERPGWWRFRWRGKDCK
ncbi:MAG: DNA polymerase ligase N-terminal domain-containing protein [Thermoguttaceae bacterium]|jgi:hypothetical protein